MATRNVASIFGIGSAIAESNKTITAKLPTSGEILLCYLFYTQHSDEQKVLWAAAKEAVNQAKMVYYRYFFCCCS